jgi:kynureninase
MTNLDPRPLDAADPLRPFRSRFAILDPGLVYLDGNSLGRPPLAALERAARVAAQEWAGELIRGWSHWLELPLRAGDAVAAAVLGAAPGTTIVTDSTTINLYRVATAALDDRPGRTAIIISRDDFPTDRYIVEGLAATRDLEIRWLDPDPLVGVTAADVAARLDGDVALVLLSLVDYRSAAIADLDAIERLARDAGAHVLWDCSHAAGSIQLDFGARDVGLAVGCSYKYLNGGPGAPAWLYVAPRLQGQLRPPASGWFAQRDQFGMGPKFDQRSGIAGWLVGTPPVIGTSLVEVGVAMIAEAGMAAIRAKSQALTAYMVALFDEILAPLGCELGTPRDPSIRGSHVAVIHPAARELCAALVARGVIPDFREPNIVRCGLSPLTTSFAEVRAGVDALAELLRARGDGPDPSA